jgi:ABC-type protease/lipase transport system fused ATPase/permease subunit
MNFIKVVSFLSSHIHTILLLLGLLVVNLAISFLTNAYYGLLALGITLIGLALLINFEKKGG